MLVSQMQMPSRFLIQTRYFYGVISPEATATLLGRMVAGSRVRTGMLPWGLAQAPANF